MKRLLAQIGITYFSVMVAAFYLPDRIVWYIAGAALLLAALFFLIRKTRRTIYLPAMAIAALLACAIHICYAAWMVQPVLNRYAGEEHTVKAVLTDEPYQSYLKYYYRLKTTEIDGVKERQKLLLKTNEPLDAQPDDTLSFSGVINESSSRYYITKGYYLVSDDSDTEVAVMRADSHTPYYYAIRLRGYMREALDHYLPEDCAALCKAILVGDKYALNLSARENFRYAGASYFIVVSGMHFSVIVMLLWRLFRRIRRIPRLILMLVFMFLYAAITGFQPSVLRSGIMVTLTVIGMTFRRQAYPLNHLGVAGLVLPFIVSPYGVGDIGLIFSFYATFSILLWATPIAVKLSIKEKNGVILTLQPGERLKLLYQRIRGKEPKQKEPRPKLTIRKLWHMAWNGFAAVLSVSIAANILIFPLSVMIVREFSLVTLLSAVLLYIEIYLILLLALFVCVCFWIPPLRWMAFLLSWPLYWLCRLVLWLVELLASLPFAFFRVNAGFIDSWIIVTVILGIVVLLYRNGYRYLKLAAFCSAFILLGGCLTHEILQSQVFSLEVYSCGDGICAAINYGGKLHLLSLDAKRSYLYEVTDTLADRYDGAQTALCSDYDELANYRLFDEDEFAISSILQYDKNSYGIGSEDMVCFDRDSVFRLEDDLTLMVSVRDQIAVPYVIAGDRRILIVPDGCSADDIPEDRMQADAVILTAATGGLEHLRCDTMIISSTEESAYLTAGALKDCYQHVTFTCENEVINYRLR